jgi:sulfate adenylyltransferase subunit 1
MDILNIATAGSVDDGKSTLIGRLLFDTGSVTTDKLESIESASKRKGLDFTDLSLLTDGLIAEREQGITIDVAHIYFATQNRKFIIADTPGHIEYTRNMFTGASHCEASMILVDARNGVTEQTRRHLNISCQLHLSSIVVCINKMDLVQFSSDKFLSIKKEIELLAAKTTCPVALFFVPVVAIDGDNVVHPSERMDWYEGEPLVNILEKLDVKSDSGMLPARFTVQYVLRPQTDLYHDYRAYAGKLASGCLHEGEEVIILPGWRKTTVKAICRGEEKIYIAKSGESISIQLTEDLDVSRGNMIVAANADYGQLTAFAATLTWLSEEKMVPGKGYILQHGSNTVKSKITSVESITDITSFTQKPGGVSLSLNETGSVMIKTNKPIFADAYAVNKNNGAFILVDESTNNTVGVGMVRE